MPRTAQSRPTQTDLRRVLFRVPEDMYEAIHQMAHQETRPVNSQMIVLIREALAARKRAKTLEPMEPTSA